MQVTDFSRGMAETELQSVAALGLVLLAALMLDKAGHDKEHGHKVMEQFNQWKPVLTKAAHTSTPIEYFTSLYNGSEEQCDAIDKVVAYLNRIMEGESDAF